MCACLILVFACDLCRGSNVVEFQLCYLIVTFLEVSYNGHYPWQENFDFAHNKLVKKRFKQHFRGMKK